MNRITHNKNDKIRKLKLHSGNIPSLECVPSKKIYYLSKFWFEAGQIPQGQKEEMYSLNTLKGLKCSKLNAFVIVNDPLIFTARNSSCGKVMFSQACVKNSAHRAGCLPHCILGHTPRQTHTPSGQTSPPPPDGYYGIRCQQAGGTHPTRMHTCFYIVHRLSVYTLSQGKFSNLKY